MCFQLTFPGSMATLSQHNLSKSDVPTNITNKLTPVQVF